MIQLNKYVGIIATIYGLLDGNINVDYNDEYEFVNEKTCSGISQLILNFCADALEEIEWVVLNLFKCIRTKVKN